MKAKCLGALQGFLVKARLDCEMRWAGGLLWDGGLFGGHGVCGPAPLRDPFPSVCKAGAGLQRKLLNIKRQPPAVFLFSALSLSTQQ